MPVLRRQWRGSGQGAHATLRPRATQPLGQPRPPCTTAAAKAWRRGRAGDAARPSGSRGAARCAAGTGKVVFLRPLCMRVGARRRLRRGLRRYLDDSVRYSRERVSEVHVAKWTCTLPRFLLFLTPAPSSLRRPCYTVGARGSRVSSVDPAELERMEASREKARPPWLTRFPHPTASRH